MKKKALSKTQKSVFNNLKMLTSAFEQTADHVMVTDIDGCILYVNPAFEETTGFTAQEAIGQTPNIIKSGKHDRRFYKNLWDKILAGKTYQGTLTNKTKSGDIYYADQTITPIQDAHGHITHFISIWKDATERVQASDELELLHQDLKHEKLKLEKILYFGEKIETITNFNKLIDFIVEQAASILESERCSLMLLDEEKCELCIKGAVGLPVDVITKNKLSVGEGIAGLVAQEGKPMLVKVIDSDDRVKRDGLPTYKTKSLLSVPIELDHKLIGVINITDKTNKESPAYTELDLKVLLAIVRQVAIAIENAQLSKELKYLTIIDPLTARYNHRYLMECLAYEIRRFKRFKRPLCLLIVDIDDFKKYNDAFGRLEGDLLLKNIGAILSENLREVDVICRYAGDEFAAILPETDLDEVVKIAKKICKAVEKFKFKKPMTVSVGIAECQSAMNRHDFVAMTNAALHKAKVDGKNRIHCQKKTGK